ncbi:hypothetical protein E4U13_006318 [Claviceps humidiphila]|uniref:Uncharacterized protein n=1 Tax=Claviceps humidiphila TaxID=1294629 RepID=A0A9P7TS15_9HYPO|nr:hypothetical protein E4U13_006318 [Claviceps humidiphila]
MDVNEMDFDMMDVVEMDFVEMDFDEMDFDEMDVDEMVIKKDLNPQLRLFAHGVAIFLTRHRVTARPHPSLKAHYFDSSCGKEE